MRGETMGPESSKPVNKSIDTIRVGIGTLLFEPLVDVAADIVGNRFNVPYDLDAWRAARRPEPPLTPINFPTEHTSETKRQPRKSKFWAAPTETGVAQVEERVVAAEARAKNAEFQLARAIRRIDAAERTISWLNQELANAKRGARNGNQDPLGYFGALGITPNLFIGLTEPQIKKTLSVIRNYKSWELHPNFGGDEKRQKTLNIATDVLSDPDRRRAYTELTGEFDPRLR